MASKVKTAKRKKAIMLTVFIKCDKLIMRCRRGEMANAPRLRRGGRKPMSVQARPPVPIFKKTSGAAVTQW